MRIRAGLSVFAQQFIETNLIRRLMMGICCLQFLHRPCSLQFGKLNPLLKDEASPIFAIATISDCTQTSKPSHYCSQYLVRVICRNLAAPKSAACFITRDSVEIGRGFAHQLAVGRLGLADINCVAKQVAGAVNVAEALRIKGLDGLEFM